MAPHFEVALVALSARAQSGLSAMPAAANMPATELDHETGLELALAPGSLSGYTNVTGAASSKRPFQAKIYQAAAQVTGLKHSRGGSQTKNPWSKIGTSRIILKHFVRRQIDFELLAKTSMKILFPEDQLLRPWSAMSIFAKRLSAALVAGPARTRSPKSAVRDGMLFGTLELTFNEHNSTRVVKLAH